MNIEKLDNALKDGEYTLKERMAIVSAVLFTQYCLQGGDDPVHLLACDYASDVFLEKYGEQNAECLGELAELK